MHERDHRFDVAISFAGEDRDFARRLATALRRTFDVFFDEFFVAEMVGRSLSEYLEKVYSTEASHCVILISEHYTKKPFTNHEKRAALSRLLVDSGYLIPIRFDDSKLTGLPEDTCYLDARKMSLRAIVRIIIQKITADKPRRLRYRIVNLDGFDVEDTRPVGVDQGVDQETDLPQVVSDAIKRIRHRYGDNVARGARREIERAILALMNESGTIKRFVGEGNYEISLATFTRLFDPEIVRLLDHWEVIEIRGAMVKLGARGRELVKRYSSSADVFHAYLGAIPYLTFGLRASRPR
jgi:hypothetical protein